MPPVTAESNAYNEYGAIVIVALFSMVLVFAILMIVHVITRRINRITASKEKLATYECGEVAIGNAWFRFNPRFYNIALIFLIFEVELAIIFPVLPRFAHYIGIGQGNAVFLKMVLFAGTLLLGLIYAPRKGDFTWNKSVSDITSPPVEVPRDA